MRATEIANECPVIEREVVVPAERIQSLRRRVRSADVCRKWAVEILESLISDAAIREDEAWQQIAELAGFKSVDDAQKQGYQLALEIDVIQVRKKA